MLIGFFASSVLFLSSPFSSLPPISPSSARDLTPFTEEISGSESITSPFPKNNRGWKDIHVFYGDTTHIYDITTLPKPYFDANQWFSQYRQDELVSGLLHGKRNGYFIDLAANDPVRISNTYALETHFDWKGLCIEPNPVYWAKLSYRKCQVVAAIVGRRTMEEVMFRYPREKAPQGGILGEQFDNKKDQWNEGHPRFTVTLLDIFEKFHVPTEIDYISLDVEGAEDLVMSSFPFSKYRFNLMSVERPSSALVEILTSNGYELLKTIRNVDTLWAHQSILQHLDKAALDRIDTDRYRYRENTGQARLAPEEALSSGAAKASK